MTLGEPGRIAALVAGQLKRENVPYAVVGSLASSVHGVPRSTRDVDIVASLRKADINTFVEALGEDFYIDPGMVREATENHSSFNIIHLATMLKVDIFVVPPGGAAHQQLEHARDYVVDIETGTHFSVASAEDTVVHKLQWYRRGGEVSEQQWEDVIGILEVQSAQLDGKYLQKAAAQLGVEDLLRKAVEEADVQQAK